MPFYEKSRYAKAKIIRDAQGRAYVPPVERPAKLDYPDNIRVPAEPGDTWSSLAYAYLGDPELWWAIAIFNNVFNPLEDPKPGTVLTIPSIRTVHEVLL